MTFLPANSNLLVDAQALFDDRQFDEASVAAERCVDEFWEHGESEVAEALVLFAISSRAAGRPVNPFADLDDLPEELISDLVRSAVSCDESCANEVSLKVLVDVGSFVEGRLGSEDFLSQQLSAAIKERSSDIELQTTVELKSDDCELSEAEPSNEHELSSELEASKEFETLAETQFPSAELGTDIESEQDLEVEPLAVAQPPAEVEPPVEVEPTTEADSTATLDLSSEMERAFETDSDTGSEAEPAFKLPKSANDDPLNHSDLPDISDLSNDSERSNNSDPSNYFQRPNEIEPSIEAVSQIDADVETESSCELAHDSEDAVAESDNDSNEALNVHTDTTMEADDDSEISNIVIDPIADKVEQLRDEMLHFKKAGQKESALNVMLRLAKLYWETDRYREAVNQYRLVIKQAKAHKFPAIQFDGLHQCAELYASLARNDDAERLFRIAAGVAKKYRQQDRFAQSILSLGVLLCHEGNFMASRKVLLRAEAMFKTANVEQQIIQRHLDFMDGGQRCDCPNAPLLEPSIQV
jgi:tetratricopeptide (TPR) repeat protein